MLAKGYTFHKGKDTTKLEPSPELIAAKYAFWEDSEQSEADENSDDTDIAAEQATRHNSIRTLIKELTEPANEQAKQAPTTAGTSESYSAEKSPTQSESMGQQAAPARTNHSQAADGASNTDVAADGYTHHIDSTPSNDSEPCGTARNSLQWAQSVIANVDKFSDFCQTVPSLCLERQSSQLLADRHVAYSVFHRVRRLFMEQHDTTSQRTEPTLIITIMEV